MKNMRIVILMLILITIGCQPKVRKDQNLIEDVLILEVPFEKQLKVLESLGYKLNSEITQNEILKELKSFVDYDSTSTNLKTFIKDRPYEDLYFLMGRWKNNETKDKSTFYTDECISYNLDYLGIDLEYVNFMKRMGQITHGELSFENIEVNVDDNNYHWISFAVNGVNKKWKLTKVNYIDDSFISRFTFLTKEFKTKGSYTYFDIGNESFVIDYATLKEQKKFNKKTGLQREWLTSGKHFSEPKN